MMYKFFLCYIAFLLRNFFEQLMNKSFVIIQFMHIALAFLCITYEHKSVHIISVVQFYAYNFCVKHLTVKMYKLGA